MHMIFQDQVSSIHYALFNFLVNWAKRLATTRMHIQSPPPSCHWIKIDTFFSSPSAEHFLLTYRHKLLSGVRHLAVTEESSVRRPAQLAVAAAVHVVVVGLQARGFRGVLERARQRVVESNAPLQRGREEKKKTRIIIDINLLSLIIANTTTPPANCDADDADDGYLHIHLFVYPTPKSLFICLSNDEGYL